MDAVCSARRVSRQLVHSDCVVRRCWDQLIRKRSVTRRLGSGYPLQTSGREDRHLVRNARVLPTASRHIQEQEVPSLGGPLSSRSIRRRLAKRHLGWRRSFPVLPLTPSHRRLSLEWCLPRGNWTAAEGYQVVFSDEFRFNLSIDDTCVRGWKPRDECLNPAFT
ncbi:transposable element Tcb2 transposase [Trichonephila clavipes]|nr:transposable element Tcb2 transposase [Trichonephila clavipes]